MVGEPYSFTFEASGIPYGFTFGASGLPPGLTIDPNTGDISGTPTKAGSFHTTIRVSNGIAPDGTRAITLVIASRQPPTITSPVPPGGRVGEGYFFCVTANGTGR
jgi:hypothetical protein